MNCRTYFNRCYNHDIRYNALKIFHLIDSITFIIRFIVVCFDLSNTKLHLTNVSFSVPILILELFASLPILLSNLVYCVLLSFPQAVSKKDHLQIYFYHRTFLRFSTLTCFACKCYHEHPAGIQLTRLVILMGCFLVRFAAFILGALCATKYNPICVPYAVLSSVFLVLSLATVLTEMFHFHVFWNFRPFHHSKEPEKHARGFLKVIPSNMTYAERIKFYSVDGSHYGCQCDSASICHTILYHHSSLEPKIPLPPLLDGKVLIAYHVTSKDKALDISKNGFPLDKHKCIKKDIYFTLHLPPIDTSGITDDNAIIYARLSLDHVLQIDKEEHFKFSKHKHKTPEPKALELIPQRHIKVKFPRQIENWMIVFLKDTNTAIHPAGYQGLL